MSDVYRFVIDFLGLFGFSLLLISLICLVYFDAGMTRFLLVLMFIFSIIGAIALSQGDDDES